MKWLEVSVAVNPEAAEAVAEVLRRYAPQGVAVELGESTTKLPDQIQVKAYLVVDNNIAELRRKVEESLWHLHHIWPAIPEPVFTPIAEQDWTAGWKESIPILHIAEHIVIKPSWRNYMPEQGEIVLEMDPGMAFGTGLHPTTRLCVEALQDMPVAGARILDLGTGTGILSFVAAKMDASEVVAVDTDMNAVVVARRNARANNVAHRIRLVHGSVADVSGTYDIVLANILAHVIIEMAHTGIATRVRSGGTLIASGILSEQATEVRTALEKVGLHVIAQHEKEDWVALIANRASGVPPSLSRTRIV